MTHIEAMEDLLRPLEVYDFTPGSFQLAELRSEAEALDSCLEDISLVAREMNLQTARSYGLKNIQRLLSRSPIAQGPESMAKALAALLRIGDQSFTLKALRDNISGCGIDARVTETVDTGLLQIVFPDVPGIPEQFSEMDAIIREIIPCHLDINYLFWYITWRELEKALRTWQSIEARGLSWRQLEAMVEKAP